MAAKMGGPSGRVEVSRETSLADAEIGKNYVQHILDIDLAGNAAEAAPRETQILGTQFGETGVERAAQGLLRGRHCLAMAGAGQQRRGGVVITHNALGKGV